MQCADSSLRSRLIFWVAFELAGVGIGLFLPCYMKLVAARIRSTMHRWKQAKATPDGDGHEDGMGDEQRQRALEDELQERVGKVQAVFVLNGIAAVATASVVWSTLLFRVASDDNGGGRASSPAHVGRPMLVSSALCAASLAMSGCCGGCCGCAGGCVGACCCDGDAEGGGKGAPLLGS